MNKTSAAAGHCLRGRLPLLAIGALLLSGCAGLAPPDAPAGPALIDQPAASAPFREAAAGAATDGPFSTEPLPARWWRLYDDALLDQLLTQALVHNTDLRQALANLERTQALEEEARAQTRPAVSLNAGGSYGHVSGLQAAHPGIVPPNDLSYTTGAALSYQLDLFGSLRHAVAASQADSEAAQAALDLVRVNVAAGTARAYAEICATGLRLQSAERSVMLQREAVDTNEQLAHAGRIGSVAVAQARAQWQQLKAAVPPLQAQRQSALYRLATLTGALPQDFPQQLSSCTRPPQLRGLIPVGDGAALLRRRPDVRQAERSLAALTARIGISRAELYPRVSMGLSAGSAGLGSGFARADTFSWSLGPLISWSLPNTGAAQARIAQSEASARAALARFDGTLLTALRETESALNTYARELDRHSALQAARDESATAAEQARRLYLGGRLAFLDSLDADRSLASSEAALAASEAALADDQILLFMALGGGWEHDAAQLSTLPGEISPKSPPDPRFAPRQPITQ